MSSYIMLTPTSSEGVKPPVPASDLVARKWAASKRKSHHREIKEHVARSTSLKEPDPDDDDLDLDPTDTDRSSELADGDDSHGDGDDINEMDDEGEFGSFPTYVCELHDPKPILIAEHIEYNRVDIAPFDPPSSSKDSSSSNGAAAKKKARYVGSHSDTIFQYEISVGPTQEIFECTPAQVLEVYKALSKDAQIAEQLRFIETNYFRDGLLGSLKRLYTSPAKLSEEMIEVLEAISDVDAVLTHAAYLELIGATKGSTVRREIDNLLQHHNRTPRSDPKSTCMCDAYQKSVDRFGAFYKEHAATMGNPERFSTVASESLMWSRGVLSFYTDTVYVLDKREFRPTHGLKKCAIYGFGRRKLFEIVRTSRKEWSIRHFHYGELYTLCVNRYMHGMKTRHMVAIKRKVPDLQHGGLRQENVCFVKKSKKLGYRCLLMGEVISRGKVTTSISIERPKSPEGDPHYHYVTMSEVSGSARDSVCSSTLSVPADYHKHLQRLHICGGSDVVAFLAVAASYDILVGAITYWMEKKY